MLATNLIIDSPEKFAPSELKNVLVSKFPETEFRSTNENYLYTIYRGDILEWLQQYYLFPKQIATFTGVGEWEGQQCIGVPFAG